MKDTTTLLVLMIATVATGFIASAAYGEETTANDTLVTTETPPAFDHAGPRAKMLERFDANHDGKLDETERAAMREAGPGPKGDMPPRRMEEGDQPEHRRIVEWIENHPEEALRIAEHARARVQHARADIIARYDTDGDHRLSEEERAALRADVEAGKVPPPMARAFKRAKQFREHMQHRRPPMDPQDAPPPPAPDEEEPA